MPNKLAPYLFLCLLLGSITLGHAQSSDLFRLEYLRIPENNTGINTSRYRALLNVPLKLTTNSYLVVGGEYNEFDIEFRKETPFNKEDVEQLHVIDFNLGFITKWNENWRIREENRMNW